MRVVAQLYYFDACLVTPAARCIDQYIERRLSAAEGPGKEDQPPIDDRLTAIVERMFER